MSYFMAERVPIIHCIVLLVLSLSKPLLRFFAVSL